MTMDQEYESNLGPRELSRYARQMSMPELGMEGQHRLRAGSVLCIGAGGLGSPARIPTGARAAGIGAGEGAKAKGDGADMPT